METDRRTLLLGGLAAGLAAPAFAQTAPPSLAAHPPLEPAETIDLWPNGAPGMPELPPVEKVTERSTDPHIGDRYVLGITRPRMVVIRPAKPNGAGVLVTPGGGYRWIVIDKEGYDVARLLAAQGYTVFVLFYRLPGDGWAAGPDVALSDAQRAMRLIRARAAEYRIDPAKVVAMGFSAGGHVCTDLIARFAAATYAPVDAADTLSARPDLGAPIYPVMSMTAPIAHAGSRELLIGKDASPELERAHSPQLHVTKEAPPCFLLHAEDDPSVPVENTLLFRDALRAAGVREETHLFEVGGHGFSLRFTIGKPVEIWPQLFLNWAKTRLFA